jgi:predicted Zn-dependent protease
VALVAAASITLQHLDKPARALALYRSALALMPRGELSLEAQYGIAQCQRALGDRAAERAALQQLRAQHPDSWFVDDVERRLAELE